MKLKPLIEQVMHENSTDKYESALRLLWRFTQTDHADGDKFDKLERERFNGRVPEKLFALMSKSSSMEDFVETAKHLNAPPEITITIDNTEWKFKKIDSTHFKRMRSDGNDWNAAMASHVGEHRGEPYYADIEAWLHGRANPNGKKY